MQYIGHPLFGDPVYGGNVAVKGAPGGKYNAFLRNMFDALPRQALHAKTLGFTHPGTQERMHFNSDLPEDMSAVLDKWRTFVGGAAN
jgi:23S rRNA pseudouridine1911/1915/1917 synthase